VFIRFLTGSGFRGELTVTAVFFQPEDSVDSFLQGMSGCPVTFRLFFVACIMIEPAAADQSLRQVDLVKRLRENAAAGKVSGPFIEIPDCSVRGVRRPEIFRFSGRV